MLNFLRNLFGSKSDKDIETIMPLVNKTKIAFEQFESLSNDELRGKTLELKTRIKEYLNEEESQIKALKDRLENEYDMPLREKEDIYTKLDALKKKTLEKTETILLEILPEAFAIVKQTAKRFKENENIEVTATEMDRNLASYRDFVEIKGDKAIYHNTWTAGGTKIKWEMVHYDVQLIGGIVLHQGKISEMATGEGKTLVATLPVFLNALPGKGVHLVTVNDYLAKRDSEWMGPIFQFNGLTVDCVDKYEPHSEERINAYNSDITYGTNNEFGFDYLRDNMSRSVEEIVQREHNYAIVDEVDSVLIDDARTPLIISGPTPKGDIHEFFEFKPRIERLLVEQKKVVNNYLNEAKRFIKEGDNEKGGIELLKAYRGLPGNKALIKFLSESNIKTLLQKTENVYMSENNKRMPEIDEHLYFVIEEKQNSIELCEKGLDLLTGASEDPHFFIMPDIGSSIAELEKQNLSETQLLNKKDELYQDFAVKSERIHTVNQLLKAYTLFEIDVDYVVIDNKVKIVDEQTGRIMEGRRYSDGLHQAIEAKENVTIEASTQTYATITLQNYFRMYHKLAGMTGTAETEAGELWNIYKLEVVVIPTNLPIIRKDMEDLVYKTKREKYSAVTKHIVELTKQGRPVLVGTTSVEVSELLSRSLKLQGIKHNVLNAKLHKREADIVADAGQPGTVTIATNMAGRGTDIKLGAGVKEAGGLAIVGTERHESRRVDRQLRGRSGRQGDPGSSQFFVSLEDDLMRLFGSDRIARLMDRMGLDEGEVIQHSMITKSIERAQKKVEENNFGIRKRLLEYDDVMNSQREVIYTKRKNALYGEKLSIDIENMKSDVCDDIITETQNSRDYELLSDELLRTLSTNSIINEEEFVNNKSNDLADKLYNHINEKYSRKSEHIAEAVFPIIKNVYENSSHTFKNIVLPVNDGRKELKILCNLEKAYKTKGKEVIKALERNITLAVIDDAWKEHLRELDDLRQSVQNASYEQKDPLLIYKFESFNLFSKMVAKINKEIVAFLMKYNLPVKEENIKETRNTEKTDTSNLITSRADNYSGESNNNSEEDKKLQPVRVEKKVGRNDLCPCGSGLKFKQCHGKTD